MIAENLPVWEKALRLFEKTTGMVTSLYLADGTRVLGPFTTTPMGETLVNAKVFEEGQMCFRAEQEELIPIYHRRSPREKKFADVLTLLGVPVMTDKKFYGVVFTGWVFDHFPDPIECDRLANLFGIPPIEFWQISRTQSPVSREKIQIYLDMLTLIVKTMTDQMTALAEVRESSRIKDEVLALVSHELKTPLTSLLLRVQMLKAHKVSEDKMGNFINSLESNTLLQTQLVEDLLDAAKITANKLVIEEQEMDMKELIEETVELLRAPANEKNITITFAHLGSDYTCIADPKRLRQCFINILTNSVKFTHRGGRIEIFLERNTSELSISFRDNGIGIDYGRLPYIFERFFQHDRDTKAPSGLGLGLYIVKRIVELHRGRVSAESSGKNQGTNIQIVLPIKVSTLSVLLA